MVPPTPPIRSRFLCTARAALAADAPAGPALHAGPGKTYVQAETAPNPNTHYREVGSAHAQTSVCLYLMWNRPQKSSFGPHHDRQIIKEP